LQTKKSYLLLYHPLQAKLQLTHVRHHLEKANKTYSEMPTSGHFGADLQSLQHYQAAVNRVIVLGGDGTLNLAINAFANTEVEVAIVPCGSGNDFARQWTCTPTQWVEAAISQPSRAIDLGKVNDRYFVNVAGVGYDAAVVEACADKRGRWAHFSYAWQGLKMLYRYAPSALHFSGNEQSEKRLLMMCFANGQYFGGGMRLAPEAKIDDGLLQCVQIGAAPFLRQLQALILSYAGKHTHLQQVCIDTLEQASIHTENVGIEADGEYIGTTPATFSVQKSALNFVVPDC